MNRFIRTKHLLIVSVLWIAPWLPNLSLDSTLVAQSEKARELLPDKQVRFFENKIRPILVKHCYECHASDSKEIKGDLRVDTGPALLKGGESGSAVVPGKPEESLLIEAIRFDGLEMPPAGKLPDHVIADFEKWIAAGAHDPRKELATNRTHKSVKNKIDFDAARKFWSFRPILETEPPEDSSTWSKNFIDQFVLSRLKKAKLNPARAANKYELIRRLYFDLTGLPPSQMEVEKFVSAQDSRAYEKLVDRLLDSPQFGVHWGRHWLDVARYADSNGGDFNATFHNAWRYRDYVVDSFNDDKPYDLFVKEQIAGDLMPHQDINDQTNKIVATGFLMLGAKMLSERDKEKMTMDVVDEQINTVGQAFLGLTLGCARCHDHKFDPIPTRDYYALAGIFKSTRTLKGESQKYVSTWPRRELPTLPEHAKSVKEFEKKKKVLLAQSKKAKDKQSKITNAIKRLKQSKSYLLVDDSNAKKTGFWKPSTISPNYVGKGYIHDDKSEKGEKWVEFALPITRSGKYEVQISYNSNAGRDKRVPVSIKHATGEKEVLVNQQKKPSIENQFEPLGIFDFDKNKEGRVTVSTRGTELYVIVDAVRLIELDSKGKPVQKTTEDAKKKIEALALEEKLAQKQVAEIANELKKLESQKPRPIPKSIAVEEADKIDDCQICIRGEHENLGKKVPRGFLQILPIESEPIQDKKSSGRLELANWIADKNNPLTSRVFVNRVWHHLFGQGIVPTVDNFGALGDLPSHPELLDHLASQFMQDKWSTKKLIRHMVLSQTYQMSARHEATGFRVDPGNRLLWRVNRKRLTAESIRDSMLSISGLLDQTPGGSPVEGLGTLVTQNTAEQTKFRRKDSLRRSLYLPMIRAELPEILTIFDIADPDLVTGRRAITNVPGQALLLLNSPFVMKQADAIAARIRTEDPNPQAFTKQIQTAYLQIFSRPVTEKELKRGVDFLEEQWDAQNPERALSRFIHTMLASTEYRMLN